MSEPDFAAVAALAGEPARAIMLATLFDGRALAAGELARAAGIAPATASAHLGKLAEGGLVRVRAQGRHRYYQLAGPVVAHALETLGAVARPVPVRSLGDALRMQRLRRARSCYNHLAGEIAVAIAQALVRHGALEPDDDGFRLGAGARPLLARIGVDLAAVVRDDRAHVRACVDWTQRRLHVAGALGAALLDALLGSGALQRRREPRALDVTPSGDALLTAAFGIDSTALDALGA